MSKSPEDRRKHQRIHTRLEIPYWKYVKFKHEKGVHIGFVKNMSRGGFYIETEVVYEKGAELGFEFFLPNSPVAVCGVGKVKWSKPEVKGADAAGMGVEFEKFNDQGEKILNDFIDQETTK